MYLQMVQRTWLKEYFLRKEIKMRLSVITINYNNALGLKKTLDSVFNQTSKDFEYIVIDGASSDDSVEVIKEYENIITYWVSEPDKGIYNAMNKGIARAKGDYCIFMNSGDVFYEKSTIERVLVNLDGTAVITGSTKFANGIIEAPSEITFVNFLRNTLAHQSSFIKTALLKKYGYDENYKIVSDWKFWIQVLVLDNLSYKSIDIVVSEYDLTGISITNTALRESERQKVLQSLIPMRILSDYEKDMNLIDNSLYWQIRQSRFRGTIYTMIVCILKFISFFKRSATWIKNYPLRLN